MSRLAEALRQAEQGGEIARDVSDAPRPSANTHTATQSSFDVNSTAVAKLVVMPAVSPAAIEQYRRLAASLHHAQLARETKVLMVTSASPGEGKTLTTTNLALTLSESYRRNVLLIDADLRRPNIHQMFQIPNVLGLSDALKSETEQRLSLIQVSENLSVLPAGRPDPDPMGGLTSDRMRRIIQEATAHFDWV